jgi:hypothetical protein
MLNTALWNCLFNVAVGLPFLLAAYVVLPRSLFRAEASPGAGNVRNWLRRVLRLQVRAARPVFRGGNAVLRKDCCFAYGGRWSDWLSCGLLMAGVGAVVYAVCHVQKMDTVDTATGLFVSSAALSALIFGVVTVVRSARAFNSEKEAHTLELLLLTKLGDGEIVRGKLGAVLLSSSPWLACSIAAVLSAAAMSVDFRGWETVWELLIVLMYIAFYGISVFSSIVLAMFLSLRFKTPAVLGICLLAFIAQNGCCWLLSIVTAIVFCTLLFTSFRPNALKEL